MLTPVEFKQLAELPALRDEEVRALLDAATTLVTALKEDAETDRAIARQRSVAESRQRAQEVEAMKSAGTPGRVLVADEARERQFVIPAGAPTLEPGWPPGRAPQHPGKSARCVWEDDTLTETASDEHTG